MYILCACVCMYFHVNARSIRTATQRWQCSYNTWFFTKLIYATPFTANAAMHKSKMKCRWSEVSAVPVNDFNVLHWIRPCRLSTANDTWAYDSIDSIDKMARLLKRPVASPRGCTKLHPQPTAGWATRFAKNRRFWGVWVMYRYEYCRPTWSVFMLLDPFGRRWLIAYKLKIVLFISIPFIHEASNAPDYVYCSVLWLTWQRTASRFEFEFHRTSDASSCAMCRKTSPTFNFRT